MPFLRRLRGVFDRLASLVGRPRSPRFVVERFQIEISGADEFLVAQGWYFMPGQDEPVSLEVTADGSVLATIQCNQDREDLVQAFASEGSSGAGRPGPCGFSAHVPIAMLARDLRIRTVPDHRVLAEASLDALRAGTMPFAVEAFRVETVGACERLRVVGWCYQRGATGPVRLRLSADGRSFEDIPCVRPREDVVALYGPRENAGATSLPRCGFRRLVRIPDGARSLRLDSPAHGIVLIERTTEVLTPERWSVDSFCVESWLPPGVSAFLVAEGWLYPRHSREPSRVQLWADDEMVADVACGIERPDVEQAYAPFENPATTPLPRCGFRIRVPLPAAVRLRLKTPGGTVLREGDRDGLLVAAGLGPSAGFVSSPQTRWTAHVENNAIRPHVRELLTEAVKRLAEGPALSILLTVASDADVSAATSTLQSLGEQLYPRWQLVVTAPQVLCEDVRGAFAGIAGPAVNVVSGGHLPDAAAAATGDWLCALHPGDRLEPHALFEVARTLQEDANADLVHGDEDLMDDEGSRRDPSFKPAWSPTRLLSHDYIGRPAFVRRAIHDAGGGFAGGAHALWLRLPADAAVRHVPGILCHRACGSPPNPVEVVAAHFLRSGSPFIASTGHGGVAVVDGPEKGPSVEIIIPTHNQVDILRRCLESLETTRYHPFSVTVVDDRSDDAATLDFLEGARARGVKVLRFDDPGGFSFARLNNGAAERSDAELLLLLNNDTEVRDPRWLSRMVAMLGPAVGAVGARLLYPDGTLQHAGVRLWMRGFEPGHELAGWPGDVPTPDRVAEATREVSAVTAACLLTPRWVWLAIGGMDERFPVSYNDVDYCLRLWDAGYRVTYAGGVELLHHESASRGRLQDPAALALLRARYRGRQDRFSNPNLEDIGVTPECRLDFAAFKPGPLRVSIEGSAWEASVVRDALASAGLRRRVEVVAGDPDVVVAAGLDGYRIVNAAADAGRPVVWAHGGPVELSRRGLRVSQEESADMRRALDRATWVVFGSAEARERSRNVQSRENFVFNRIAVAESVVRQTAATREAARCRVVWGGAGDADSDPAPFVRAFHRLPAGLPVAASWFLWSAGGEPNAHVARARALDERLGRRCGRHLGPPCHGDADALDAAHLFVSTATGWDDPRPLLHATERGLAILAPLECGLGERAILGINAWSYALDNDRALAARIEALVSDRARLASLGEQSRHVSGCFSSFDGMADRWADLLWGAWHMGPRS